MVRDDVARSFEPEVRQTREHTALVGDLVREHDVEDGDTVARDHEHAVVTHFVELAHLARVDVRQRGRLIRQQVPQRVQGVEDAARVGERALEVEAGVEPCRVERRGHVGILAQDRRGTLRSSCQARMALRCTSRYASSRVVPDSTEREQHRLAEHEPERCVDVAEHALGVDAHAREAIFVNRTVM